MENIIFLLSPLKIVLLYFLGLYLIFLLKKYIMKNEEKSTLLINIFFSIFILIMTYHFFSFYYTDNPTNHFLKAILSLPIILFIPGFLLYVSLSPRKSDFFEFFYLCLLGSFLISGLLGIILAEIGIFSLINLTLLLILLSFLFFFKSKKDLMNFKIPNFEISNDNMVIIFLILISLVLFFHPSEWIISERDPGIYISNGVDIAKSGSIVKYDENLKDLTPREIENIYILKKSSTEKQFVGYYITDFSEGRIVPQFFYLYSIWLAIFYSIFDLKLALYVTPLLALFGVVSLFFLGRLIHPLVGYFAGFLLALNFAQVWYAKFHSSEPLTQFLFLGGLFSFISFIRTKNKYFGIISALSFSEIFLARIDTIYILFPILFYFGYLEIKGKLENSDLYFIIPFVLIGLYALMSALLISTPYLEDHFINVFNLKFLNILIGFFSLLFILLLFNSKIKKKFVLFLGTNTEKLILMIIIFANILFFYGIFIHGGGFFSDGGNTLAKLSWYMGGLTGMIVAAAGFSLFIRKAPYKERLFIASLALIYGLIFLKTALVRPDHPWWVRRYLPIIIPLFTLFMSYSIYRLWSIENKMKFIAPILLIFMCASIFIPNIPIIDFQEYKGAIDQTEKLSAHFDENDTVFFLKSKLGSFASPLYYIYDRNTILFWDTSDRTSVNNIISRELDRGRDVYFLYPDFTRLIMKNILEMENFYSISDYAELNCLLNEFELEIVGRDEINLPELERTEERLPYKTSDFWVPVSIFKIEAADKNHVSQLPFYVTMGTGDDCITNNFNAREFIEGIPFRWTKNNSKLIVPLDPIEKDLNIDMLIGGYRPPDDSANVRIIVNNYTVKDFVFQGENEIISFSVPGKYIDSDLMEIEILTNTWNPKVEGINSDDRELGVILYLIILYPSAED